MKKILFVTLAISICFIACNNPYTEEGEKPFIDVIGSAEMEIEPDEIHLSVTVGNFSEVNRNGTGREILSLDQADKKFMDILSNLGIKKDQIVLNDASTTNYWTYYLRYGRYMENVRLEKSYEIVLNNYTQLDSLLKILPGPKDGIVSVNISELNNNNISEYRKQVKAMALKAAKEKADYLLQAIGSKSGKPIYVKEIEDELTDINLNQMYSNKQMVLRQEAAFDMAESSQPQMKKIKLKYNIQAKFEIK